MIKQCRFCNQNFKALDVKFFQTICVTCVDSLRDTISNDENLRGEIFKILGEDKDMKFEFLDTIIGDEKVIKRIARAAFDVDVKEIGLGGPGSIAEFFRTSRDT